MLLKILWIIFHNIFKYMILQSNQKVLLWGKGLCFPERNNECADRQADMNLCCLHVCWVFAEVRLKTICLATETS